MNWLHSGLVLVIFLAGCAGTPLTSSTQTQETTQEQDTALRVSTRDVQEQTNTNTAVTSNASSQEAQTATGAAVKSERVETVNSEVLTTTNNGIPIWWFILGSLILGMILPQPRFIRWLF
jgi:thiol:disulfide interchange protein